MNTDPVAIAVESLVTEWLTLTDVAEMLGVEINQVRQYLSDGDIVAVRRGERSVTSIPALFIVDGQLVKHLRGTLTVLADSGYSTLEAIKWLHTDDDSLPGSPIEALRSNRGTEVKRRAQALAL
ncbi:MAG TPA: Rv2175c family DNA-binding protein [Candidatus Nanopelagicaceae bacterium]|nr:Rv2175c family DNA-binding protein [Candidatus Nanopelagicaceae bacterium]